MSLASSSSLKSPELIGFTVVPLVSRYQYHPEETTLDDYKGHYLQIMLGVHCIANYYFVDKLRLLAIRLLKSRLHMELAGCNTSYVKFFNSILLKRLVNEEFRDPDLLEAIAEVMAATLGSIIAVDEGLNMLEQNFPPFTFRLIRNLQEKYRRVRPERRCSITGVIGD